MISEHEYMEEIDRIAREALEAERDYGTDAYDSAWEQVDWHGWVIYTYKAKQILALASSDGASILDCMDLNATYRERGLDGLLSSIAFACMLEDVHERIAYLREKEEED